MKHEKYTITTTFVVCDGVKDKVLDEIKDLTQHIRQNSLSHASDLKIVVTHDPTGD